MLRRRGVQLAAVAAAVTPSAVASTIASSALATSALPTTVAAPTLTTAAIPSAVTATALASTTVTTTAASSAISSAAFATTLSTAIAAPVASANAVAAQVDASLRGVGMGARQHVQRLRQLVRGDGRLPEQRDVGGGAGAVQQLRRSALHAVGASYCSWWRLRARRCFGVGVGRVPACGRRFVPRCCAGRRQRCVQLFG